MRRRQAMGWMGSAFAGLAGAAPLSACRRARPPSPPPGSPQGYARIDMHTHVDPSAIDRLIALMDRWGLAGVVNLSGMHPGPPRQLLETQLEAARRANGRVAVFTTPNFIRALRTRARDYGVAMAEDLERGKGAGAVGLKITKGLGLGYPAPDQQHFLAVDDPGLDPLFEKAGELGMPVAIHSGDPKAFWLPADEHNERWDELQAHPEWSFHGLAGPNLPWPSWDAIFNAFVARVARHPKTTFIGVHFGNDPEDPGRVGRLLDEHANLYVDTAARVPEIGRQDPAKMRAFFTKYQNRILFGTDTGVGPTNADMMYGSNGSQPPTPADEERFFRATYRYFETNDRQFESPTPIQGRWKIDGIGLPANVLQNIYYDNASRLLGWRPQKPIKAG